METIFTKIIKGEIPSYKVAETADFYAFLDINPLAEAHTLLVPKLQIDYIFDMDDKILAEMHVFSKKIALAIEKTVKCERVGIAVVGLEVPHAHIHLIPLNTIYDIDFSKPKLQFTEHQFKNIAEKIASKIDIDLS
jgi:histidine triad (HIT) family protein